MSNGFFNQITPTTYGVFGLLAVVIVAVVKVWPIIIAKLAETRTSDDAIAGKQMERLVAEVGRLDHRVQSLEVSEERCREELADAKGRIAELEGYNIGAGKARAEAQRIVSTEREADRHGRRGTPPQTGE